MAQKIDMLMISILFVSGGNILAGLGSLAVILYYLSMLRKNVVNKDHSGSWWAYIKSWVKK